MESKFGIRGCAVQLSINSAIFLSLLASLFHFYTQASKIMDVIHALLLASYSVGKSDSTKTPWLLVFPYSEQWALFSACHICAYPHSNSIFGPLCASACLTPDCMGFVWQQLPIQARFIHIKYVIRIIPAQDLLRCPSITHVLVN